MLTARTTFFAVVAAASLFMAGVQAIAGEPPLPETAPAAVGDAFVGAATNPG
jgi:hypothetical protein